jgi:hypothetical protein
MAPDGSNASFAQYTTPSLEQLRRKLRQYPPGTAFRVTGIDKLHREPAEQAVRAAGQRLAP